MAGDGYSWPVGGQAHLFVLEQLARTPLDAGEVILVAPTRYSFPVGMLPEWMGGYYREEEWRIDLRALCARARIRFIEDRIAAIDARQSRARFVSGATLAYGVVSLELEGETDVSSLAACGNRLLALRPSTDFCAGWQQLVTRAQRGTLSRIVVIGEGRHAVELAFAAQKKLGPFGVETVLISGEAGLLSGYPEGVRRRIQRLLRTAGIKWIREDAVGSSAGVFLGSGRHLAADTVLAATNVRPPHWLRQSGLDLDPAGFVLVDSSHRSVSHPNVFCVGETCTPAGGRLPGADIHAARTGSFLAHNLRAALCGEPLRMVQPRAWTLSLLSCGPGYAVAAWGPLHFEGRLAWKWKETLDRSFIARFSFGSLLPAFPCPRA